MNELASVKRQKTDAGSGTCAATHNKKILGEVRPGLATDPLIKYAGLPWREPGGQALPAPNVCGSDFAYTKPARRRFDHRLGPRPGRKRPSSSGIQGSLCPRGRRRRRYSRNRRRGRRRWSRRRLGRLHPSLGFLLGGFLRSFFLGGLSGRLFLLPRRLLLRYCSALGTFLLLLAGLLLRGFLRSLPALRCHAQTPSLVDKSTALLRPAALDRIFSGWGDPSRRIHEPRSSNAAPHTRILGEPTTL